MSIEKPDIPGRHDRIWACLADYPLVEPETREGLEQFCIGMEERWQPQDLAEESCLARLIIARVLMARGDRLGKRFCEMPWGGKEKLKAFDEWLSLEERAMNSYMQASNELVRRYQSRERAARIRPRARPSAQPAVDKMPPLDPNIKFIM